MCPRKFPAIACCCVLFAVFPNSEGATTCVADDSPEDGLTMLQASLRTQSNATLFHSDWQGSPPTGVCDKSLQAPADGGAFSEFFNKRTTGHGIHKWLQYFPAYQRHFAKFIGKEVHIVEIGIQSGGSMDLWKSVFGPGAHVYGCDVQPNCKIYEDSRTKIFIGDQESPEFWTNFRKQVPRIDILIDDGGHTVEQQIATLGIMLQHISPGGVYMTEDVHGQENLFWKNLQFERLTSPAGKHYAGLNTLVSSAHIYPYLLVLERAGSNSAKDMVQHLGTKAPNGYQVAVLDTAVEQRTQSELQGVFPWLRWSSKPQLIMPSDANALITDDLHPSDWLLVSDGVADFSLNAPWDSQTDQLLSRMISSFKQLHAGSCCNVKSNVLQQKIESIHIYPHLSIAKLTDGKERLIKAPAHGDQWIPY